MNKLCECPAAGWCARHQKKKGPEQFKRCQGTASTADGGLKYWNAWERGQAGATAPANPQIDPEGFGFHPATEEWTISTIGSQLHEIIKRETGIEIPCPDCLAAILLLDSQTPDEVRPKRQALIADIQSRALKQAPELWQKIAIFADGIFHTGQVEARIGRWVDEAIETGAEPKKKEVPKLSQRTLDLRNRIAAAEAQRRNSPAPIRPLSKPTADQMRLFRLAKSKTPDPKPFATTPRFNLVWHFWPVPGAWEWHADRMRELLPTINGLKIIGIATDETTNEAQVVIDRINNPDVQYILAPNTPNSGDLALKGQLYGELTTAIPAFDQLSKTTDDSVTIYGHAKGARGHTKDSESVQLWSEIMYETVTFNREETIAVMQAGYDVIGAFRTFGFRPLIPKHSWHYSGTFYNFRTRSVFADNAPIQLKYGGTEAWPGDHVPAEHAWCSFGDNSPWLRQYKLSLMYPKVVNEQMQWEVDRIGGPRCEQHKRELDWLIGYLNPTDRVLVIGSKHGGLEAAIKRRLPDAITVSVDIAPQQDNTQDVIVGNSQDAAVQAEVIRRGPFDVVFIDGDHSYAGVKADWTFAKTLDARIVALHDIATAVKHRNEGCEVDQLWSEIKQAGQPTEEKIVGCGWGGIGIVWRDRSNWWSLSPTLYR